MIVQLEDSLLKKEHPTQEESPESITSTVFREVRNWPAGFMRKAAGISQYRELLKVLERITDNSPILTEPVF